MSRGRKAKTTSTGLNWEQIFNKSRGVYFQYVITELGKGNKKLSEDSANDLLEAIKQEKEKLAAEKKIKIDTFSRKITDEEIPFKIPNNWTWCRLKEIGFFTGGGTPSMSNSNYWDGDISWVSPKDMGLDYVSESEMKITKLGVENSAAKIIPPNSILIVGRSGILKRKLPVAINLTECTVNQDLKVIVPYLTQMTSYLQLMLFGLERIVLKDYIKFGMTVHSLKYKEFEEMPIPLPPLSEQKIILDFFQDFGKNAIDKNREYFDSEIENEVISIHQAQIYNNQISTELNHQLALVKELRQAYLREAMQGKLARQDSTDEPAEILLEKIKAEKEKLVAEKRIRRDKPLPPINSEEISFEIPSNWTWCRLGECSINRDGERVPISLPERERRKKIYDYYGASGVIDKIDNFTHDGRFLLIGEDGANLVARSTPIAFIAEGKFWVNNHAHVIETVNKITTDYLCNYLNGISLKPYITGGFQPKLSQGNLNVIVIPLPPLAEQERIVAKLEKLMKFCDELEANIRQGISNADQLLQTALKEALEPKEEYAL